MTGLLGQLHAAARPADPQGPPHQFRNFVYDTLERTWSVRWKPKFHPPPHQNLYLNPGTHLVGQVEAEVPGVPAQLQPPARVHQRRHRCTAMTTDNHEQNLVFQSVTSKLRDLQAEEVALHAAASARVQEVDGPRPHPNSTLFQRARWRRAPCVPWHSVSNEVRGCGLVAS